MPKPQQIRFIVELASWVGFLAAIFSAIASTVAALPRDEKAVQS